MTADDRRPALLRALRNPASLAQAGSADWELLIRQARSADLLARLAWLADTEPQVAPPAPARAHLAGARLLAQAQHDELMRELGQVRAALAPLAVEPVLLKGAAYVAAELPAARGRVFTDIDLMLPRPLLPQAEAQLMLHGWATTHHSPYDQRYYRQWMHELPPLRHIRRQTVLDLHHAILPQTARLRPDSLKLQQAAVPAALAPGFRVLAPVDMVLHSICHLTHDEVVRHALRDLVDIDQLLRAFSRSDAGFWDRLVPRAVELDLARPLHYALRHAHGLLGTPVPAAVLAAAAAHGAPAPWIGRAMDALWLRAFTSAHATMAPRGTAAALTMLYVRAHWLRMPPLLLARHLTVKALRLHEAAPEPTR